ncbi:hypothetical protein [Rhodococcus sp. IEGM 1307]|uniref:hypothetical protein n=1 Tax=Rhodococcus sp. IEGM 1307 TaxID=3047091 RepID=UPI0024B805B8|nr:hypothetical protein [Rhodococcus sp. IEGM 1307]MDI9979270.1 hypothetical protein [Rhodococcus sp. IEGM 1307]
MTTHTHLTTGHEEIRQWTQAHHGIPARVPHTTANDVLRIDLHGVDSGLEHISWREWFAAFDQQGLALSYPDPHLQGGISAWFELVPRPRPRTADGPQ